MWKGKCVMPFEAIKMGNPGVGDKDLWTECRKESEDLVEKVLGIYEEAESVKGARSKVRSLAR
jgi:hypothetical protein